jgi:hypoxanthine phosphoribosyltransferase
MEKAAVPRVWRDDIESVLVSEKRLAARVRDLAFEIERDFSGRDLVMVALLSGTVVFLADLLRELRMPLRLDFMAISSYGNGATPGPLVLSKDLRLNVRGRDVLVVDDIADSGRTLDLVLTRISKLKPRRLKTCVLLDKTSRRVRRVPLDYVGFRIPNAFVVGYGLDFAERYRNLPFVGVLLPSLYTSAAATLEVPAPKLKKRKGRIAR